MAILKGANRRLKPLKPLKPLPVRTLAPNILTLLSLCAGMTSIRFGLDGRWEFAVMAIMVAAIFDALDGSIARALKGATKFGAELDSLSDVVSFGVAPALLLYNWTLKDLGGLGWVVALLFTICCALRLARFNTVTEEEREAAPWKVHYYTGVPVPAGAGLSLLPLFIAFQFELEFSRIPILSAVLMMAVSFLMVSKIPTYSFKRLGIRRDYVLPLLIAIGLIAAFLTSYLWGTVMMFGVIYLATLPFSIGDYRSEKSSYLEQSEAAAEK
ncbi:MAG: CDP-diacylglycerol--serine O-phosphatidyltransferase [Sphingomonadales bacterium]